MRIGQPIGRPHLVDEAVEDADNAIAAVQSHVHARAHAVNAETLLTRALAPNKADAPFVKM